MPRISRECAHVLRHIVVGGCQFMTVCFIPISLMFMALLGYSTLSGSQPEGQDAVSGGQEKIAIYQLAAGAPTTLANLMPVPDSWLTPVGSMSINQSHANGVLHRGIRVHLLDSTGKLLMLRRGEKLRTCPGSWGLIGEHVHEGETPPEAAARALKEELGVEASDNILFSHNITRQGRAVQYSADERIENQVTWMHLVVLGKPAEQLTFKFDREVLDHKWVQLSEFSEWMARSPQDFCGDTQRTLGMLGILRLKPCYPFLDKTKEEWSLCLHKSRAPRRK